MTTTAILSALAEEQQGLVDQLRDPAPVTHAGRTFWTGTWHGVPVVLALSRIGKVAAATTATTLIEHFGVSRIVFTGVAGAIGHPVQVGDIVVARGFVQHDMDASPLFPRFEIPLYARARFECDVALTALLAQAGRQTIAAHAGRLGLTDSKPQMHEGLIATGDSFVSTGAAARSIRQALGAAGFDALAVEMEGAAVAQVCLDYGVPFAAVRTISDRADEHAALDFQQFVTQVARHYTLAIVDHCLRALAHTDRPVI